MMATPPADQAHFTTSSPEETAQLGQRLGELARGGELVLLSGGLGAGKTCLSQGIASGLGVTEAVSSPTFTLVNVYDGRIRMYHVDLYRIESAHEVEDLGLEEMIGPRSVVVVEWAERGEDLWPDDRLAITIEPLDGDRRRLSLHATGDRSRRLLGALSAGARAARD